MADTSELLYLEPDDEITSVVRRLRQADAARVVLVASGRTKATASAVALRLLAQVAAEEGRQIALVADTAARALAGEAGIPAFASVADANAQDAVPLQPQPPQRAPIHVVRGEPEPAAPDLPAAELTATPVLAARGMEETQAVPVQRPARYPVPRSDAASAGPAPSAAAAGSRGRRAPRARRVAWALPVAVLLLLVAAGVALGMVLPAATVTIHPHAVAVGPLTYAVRPPVHEPDGEELSSTQQGEATGHRTRRTPATGEALLINYSPDDVSVPAGTVVSVGGQIQFRTTAGVTVPESFFAFVGTALVPIEALEAGPQGNVEANAIDTIEDRDIDRALRGPGPDERRIRNDNATSGGAEEELLIVRQRDIDAVTTAIRDDLRSQLAEQRTAAGADRIVASGDDPRPDIEVPDDLLGHASVDPYTFELTGTLSDDQPYGLLADVQALASAALTEDESAAPTGSTIEPDSVEVEPGEATLDGDELVVQAEVTAQATPQVDQAGIPALISGRTADAAEQRLSAIGDTTVTLWPFWVDRVPGMEWRISVQVQDVEPVNP